MFDIVTVVHTHTRVHRCRERSGATRKRENNKRRENRMCRANAVGVVWVLLKGHWTMTPFDGLFLIGNLAHARSV